MADLRGWVRTTVGEWKYVKTIHSIGIELSGFSYQCLFIYSSKNQISLDFLPLGSDPGFIHLTPLKVNRQFQLFSYYFTCLFD